jgi:catechol 2,3-dioxygenase-like lactoylglutathione lyase family enzyme
LRHRIGGVLGAVDRAAQAPGCGRRTWEETLMIEANGIDHIVLHVEDVQRSKKFYTDVLGMTPYRGDGGQAFLHAGRQGLALFERRGGTPPTAGNDLNHLAFNVAGGTYETLKSELERHGVAVSGRPGEDRCFYFCDPDGHRLQLVIPR